MQDTSTEETSVTEHPGHGQPSLCSCTTPLARIAQKCLQTRNRLPKLQGATRLLVVDTQTCGSFMRANVSLGPPRHAAQLGAAGATHPAASNTCTHSLRQTQCWFCRPSMHLLMPGNGL